MLYSDIVFQYPAACGGVLLLIVQPNNMTQQPDTYAARITSELRARLAWVVVYKVNAEDGDGMIDVYIDAKDGSFLGGYF